MSNQGFAIAVIASALGSSIGTIIGWGLALHISFH